MNEYFVLAAFTQTNGKPIRLAAISMLLSVKGQLKSPRCSVTFKYIGFVGIMENHLSYSFNL